MDILQQLLTKARAYWAGLSAPHRFLAAAIAAAVALTAAAVSFLSLNAEYVPVAPAMAPEEVGAIVAHLESATIPYRLDPAGTTVLVPKDRLARARVELAGKGVTARGGKGWGWIDDMSFAAPPAVVNMNYVRALQEELARSIMQLEPVSSARVHIARGEPTPFTRNQQPTTASVVLKLKPGAGMNRTTAASIVSLVARSIEGLKPENVTVVDSTGRLLSDPRAGDPEGLSAEQLEYRQKLESYLGQKAEEMLVRSLGLGRAFVRVSVDLNHQKMKEVSIKYSPEERVARSENTVSVKSAGGSDARGVAGAGSNTGRKLVSTGGSSGGSNETDENKTEYAVPETRRETESNLHNIQRITVAVMADLTPREGAKTPSSSDVEAIVKQAIGYQSGRDEIKVSDVSLDGDVLPPEPSDKEWVERAQGYVHLARNIALLVAFAFLAVTVFVLARRFASPPKPKAEPPSLAPTDSAERQRFLDLARDEPQEVARVLSAMLRP